MRETPFLQDLSRGFACRCPNCGEGALFQSFLKTKERCDVCGEEFHHHRADDFPAYVVILLLGHIMVPFALALEDWFAPPFWVHIATTMPLTIVLCLVMLQPVKGAIIALQWRMGMHGFGKSKKTGD
jgi:uncharacterized protein (DUF983 family)